MMLFLLCLGSPGVGHTQQRTFQVPVLLIHANSTQDLHGTSQTQVLNPPLCPSLRSRLCSSTRCNPGCMSAVQAVSLQLIILTWEGRAGPWQLLLPWPGSASSSGVCSRPLWFLETTSLRLICLFSFGSFSWKKWSLLVLNLHLSFTWEHREASNPSFRPKVSLEGRFLS